jgi:cation transport ATPase
VPTDAIVIAGTTYVDESMITGEPLAVLRQLGDAVVGGTINQNGMVIVRAQKVSNRSITALFEIADYELTVNNCVVRRTKHSDTNAVER